MKKKAIAILLTLLLTLCFASASMAFAWPTSADASQTEAAENGLGAPLAGGSTFFGGILIGLSIVSTIANRNNKKK